MCPRKAGRAAVPSHSNAYHSRNCAPSPSASRRARAGDDRAWKHSRTSSSAAQARAAGVKGEHARSPISPSPSAWPVHKPPAERGWTHPRQTQPPRPLAQALRHRMLRPNTAAMYESERRLRRGLRRPHPAARVAVESPGHRPSQRAPLIIAEHRPQRVCMGQRTGTRLQDKRSQDFLRPMHVRWSRAVQSKTVTSLAKQQ